LSRIESHIRSTYYERPTLIIDTDVVKDNYIRLKAGMPKAHIHYAVKSNPHPDILKCLVDLGSSFDAASRGEIEMCLAAGAKPQDISFGNTVKRPQDIEWAYKHGIDLFAADAEEELEKIAEHAPNSKVFIRILIRSTEAEWPLSRKFGCSSSYAVPLIAYAAALGLDPVGLSFHVGSQTRHPHMWLDSLDSVSAIWNHAKEEGFDLWLLNIGGGFPAYYGVDITPPEEYGTAVMAAVKERFEGVTYIMAEPGRGMVGSAGCIAAEVLLVSRKTPGDPVRWVYLNIGRFSGLAETEGEAIKYQFIIPGKESSETSECIIAGPTCDSADVLYEDNKVQLPVDLKAGDKFIIKSCGAYTSTYSTIAFNGFPPLRVEVLK
jgi:ornithine decarboxylase